MKRWISLLAALTLVLGCMAGAFAEAAPKYTVETMKDGWIKVTQEGGKTLGYSPDSGVTLLEDGGFAFKDLNKNGELDVYEDWRLDDNTRAADLAARMTTDQISGLMVYSGGMTNNMSAKLDENQQAALKDGLRGIQNGSITNPVRDQVRWYNAIQAYTEALGNGVPALFCSDPRNSGWGIGVSPWPDNLALAATFDPANAFEAYQSLSEEYRALGIGTLLGPQTDIASEPRWGRSTATFGEDPALSRDMMNAASSALQSTYDEEGNDLGWGKDSVNAMMKHFPGDGAAQSGREAHDATGSFNVYPNGLFKTQLVPFIDGALHLDGATESVSAAMTSYSIAWSEDEEYGELVASAFSEYKVQLLRGLGFDGVICTDWQVLTDGGKVWGVEDLTPDERISKALQAGVDQFGGESDLAMIRSGITQFLSDVGEEEGLASLRESARRLLRNTFQLGYFENPYLVVSESADTVMNEETTEKAFAMQEKTVVMLKNDGVIRENTSDEKPTVYIPLIYTPSTMGFVGQNYYSADLPVDKKILNQYFNVVTDTIAETLTGPADDKGNPTLAYEDVIRASREELAQCDYALVFTRAPKNTSYWSITGGYDMFRQMYVPISLQYGEYVADGDNVREESIAGRMIETTMETPYGPTTTKTRENQTYYGAASMIDYPTDLDMILYAAENMPEDKPVIVAINTQGKSPIAQMVVSEFEDKVDAILYGFNIDNRAYLNIAAGKVEPSALLPVQLPASMDAVEAQAEDTPRDMECYVDAQGNVYDFAYGLNWSGVINDERVAKYNVPALTEPETAEIELAE